MKVLVVKTSGERYNPELPIKNKEKYHFYQSVVRGDIEFLDCMVDGQYKTLVVHESGIESGFEQNTHVTIVKRGEEKSINNTSILVFKNRDKYAIQDGNIYGDVVIVDTKDL